jgi:hypothetical protein
MTSCSLLYVVPNCRETRCLQLQSTLEMKLASSSETLINAYETTRRQISEDHKLNLRRCEDLKSQPFKINNPTYDTEFPLPSISATSFCTFAVRGFELMLNSLIYFGLSGDDIILSRRSVYFPLCRRFGVNIVPLISLLFD